MSEPTISPEDRALWWLLGKKTSDPKESLLNRNALVCMLRQPPLPRVLRDAFANALQNRSGPHVFVSRPPGRPRRRDATSDATMDFITGIEIERPDVPGVGRYQLANLLRSEAPLTSAIAEALASAIEEAKASEPKLRIEIRYLEKQRPAKPLRHYVEAAASLNVHASATTETVTIGGRKRSPRTLRRRRSLLENKY